ncbi:MAG: tetratricopeptide repeat protein [Acidobacteriaceae bacterium]|nr:tetratricopeptide repeat protein [Acidobacteriaceae bacterium]
MNAKRYAEAEQAFLQAEAEAPGTTNALALRAKALIHLNRFEEAEQCLTGYLKSHDRSSDAKYLLAYTLFRLNRPRESLGVYTAAAELRRPTWDDLKIVGVDYVLRAPQAKAALAAMRSGDKARAITILATARKVLPEDPDLARTYLAENLAGPAEEEMRKYVASRPDDATALYGFGYILLAEQRIDDANSFFQDSLTAQSNQTESLFQLGEIALQQNQDAVAEDDFHGLLVRDSRHGGAWTEIGVIAFRAFHYEEAKSDLQRAIESAPSYQKAHYYYALRLSKLGRKTDAERESKSRRVFRRSIAPNLTSPGRNLES